MKIGINGYEAVVPRFGYDSIGLPRRVGSSEYCYQLLLNLSKIDKKNEYFIYLPINPSLDMPPESSNWHYKIIKKRSVWTLFDLSFYFLWHKKLDVFFSPTHYLTLYTPFPSVLSILDVSYIKYPELFKKKDLFQLKVWSKYSVNRAKKILTISQSSKDDIIKIYGVPDSKVIVTYPGIKVKSQNSKVKTTMQNSKLLQEKYGINGNYILFVGTLQPRKNIVRLIEAFSIICHPEHSEGSKRDSSSSTQNDVQLMVIGKRGWLYEEILSSPKKFEIENRVKFLDFVPDEDLPSFYKNAICFVLPSLYEGFGLPILEAMKYGCPVVTSSVSSLPEAGGDAALYVDPENVSDIASKISQLIENDKLRKELIEKGYKQVEKFSWEKTAKKTLEELEKIAKS